MRRRMPARCPIAIASLVSLQLELLIVDPLLVFVLLRGVLVLNFPLLKFQDAGLCLLFQRRLLFDNLSLCSHDAEARLLVQCHLLALELLVHLYEEFLLLHFSGLTQVLLLMLILLFYHTSSLVQLGI